MCSMEVTSGLLFSTVAGYSGPTFVDVLLRMEHVFAGIIGYCVYLIYDQDVLLSEGVRKSTFNIPSLYKYKLTNHFDVSLQRFILWTIYSLYASAVMFYIPFYSSNDIVTSDGLNGWVWGQGFGAQSIYTFANISIVWISTRTFSKVILCWYIIQIIDWFANLPLIFYSPISETQYNIYDVFSTPTFYLSVFVGAAAVGIPVYAAKAYEMVVKKPEYYRR